MALHQHIPCPDCCLYCVLLCCAVLLPVGSSQAARKRGKDTAAVQSNLQALESILPNLINLHKMKAADWVSHHCLPDPECVGFG
jgi:hypothetical protein